ncbi:truncated hemoglobin [Streptomyces sp. NL15-2K]|uniref:truncated hemoglobin n=1 Tax=Streptomyces sp. NL15-2K TaxID=376149 RepID=UPI000F565D1F|nr:MULTISPECIES: hypothetical protein [Actinomycetes]WKX10512.1 hypothetical protein Q4V64_24595 [Kutzneria buriramensis]GCB47954.1 hemoglobin-like protein HbO [Streptomyces sp. NL15-2K]
MPLQKVFIAADGETKVEEDVTLEAAGRAAVDFYERIGGERFFRRLAAAFYKRVAEDDLLSPLFDGEWESHIRRLSHYFVKLYGEPDLQSAWEPHVLAAHTHFVVTNDQRLRWLELMRAAGEDIGTPEDLLADFIGVMTIASLDMTACSRGAAIARGQRIDRHGNVLSGPGEDAVPDGTDRTPQG